MHSIILIAAATVQQEAEPPIIVTASREPVEAGEAAVSSTLFDEERIEALDLPMATDLLRLSPGLSVSASGPRGTQTQVRIRGAETNHSLLFVDGIRFNDPAADNFARFELLTVDPLTRIEVVRGPQSALWGSEALGGVIAAETADPLRRRGLFAQAEYGSLDSARAAVRLAERIGDVGIGLSAGWMASEGIDSFGGGGERDGFETRSASARLAYAPLAGVEFGLVGHWIDGFSEFDGTDPATFRRADTLDETENRIGAVRGWAEVDVGGWAGSLSASYLDSANRNRIGEAPVNSTFGSRMAASAQLSRTFGGHRLTAAIEHEAEDFRARDEGYFGLTNQDRSRDLTAFVGEWRAQWSPRFTTDIAVRHDSFSAFADATTLRATAAFRPGPGWIVHAGYGQGIAQPSFNDLYGFFPGSFAGNPDLKPERSHGFEAGVRWTSGSAGAGVTLFSTDLRDEIVDVYDPATFLFGTANAEEESRRRGIEFDAHYAFPAATIVFNYSFLDAEERVSSASAPVREIRRPRHSANLMAYGERGQFGWSASLAYVGERTDMDFDLFPAERVTLGDYLLGSLRLAWRLTPALEAYARVENALDADYRDVVGYATAGRTVHAGLRLRLGD